MFGARESSAEDAEHSAVRHHEHTSARVVRRDVGEGRHRSRFGGLGGLETRGPSTGFEPAWPLRLDVATRESLPFTGVVLSPSDVDSARGARDDFGKEIGGHRRSLEIARDHEIERWAFGCDQRTGLSSLQPSERGERGIGLTLPFPECVPFALPVTNDEDSGDVVRVDTGHERSRYPRYARDVVTLRLFAQAREAAGTARDVVSGSTVAEVVEAARQKYGERFVAILPTCRIWLNGEEVHPSTAVSDNDEVAVLPPVSGGCR